MNQHFTNQFSGFRVANPEWWKFDLILRAFKVNRAWFWSSLQGNEPEFETLVRGEAVSEGKVCVFGQPLRSNVFDLTLKSEKDSVELWRRIKSIDITLGYDEGDAERLRVRGLQHNLFDKKPPTAALWYREGWSLECRVPPDVLIQLVKDLVTFGAECTSLQIEWPFGLIDDQSGSWGLFEESQLRGYVTKFSRSLPHQEGNRTVSPDRNASFGLVEQATGGQTHAVGRRFFRRKVR